MKLAELSEVLSAKTKVEAASVKKVLTAAFAVLSEQMNKEERTQVQGLGTFIKKAGKKTGAIRISFKPPQTKAEREKKKETRKSKTDASKT